MNMKSIDIAIIQNYILLDRKVLQTRICHFLFKQEYVTFFSNIYIYGSGLTINMLLKEYILMIIIR
jgi:hypothetical protein